jgi:hypothetical protein
MGRKSSAKAERRAIRPPPAIAETVARIEARMAKMDALHPGWAGYLDSMIRDIPRDWPEWCLIPMAGATAVAQQIGEPAEPTAAAEMAALFTWSKGRSIYAPIDIHVDGIAVSQGSFKSIGPQASITSARVALAE